MRFNLNKFFGLFNKTGFIKKGSCKKCGTCCRNITFKVANKYITEIYEFERLKQWQPRYNHFYISGEEEDGTLLFACNSLDEDNLCRDYIMRSLFCRLYPIISSKMIAKGQETLDDCGYYYVSKENDTSLHSKHNL